MRNNSLVKNLHIRLQIKIRFVFFICICNYYFIYLSFTITTTEKTFLIACIQMSLNRINTFQPNNKKVFLLPLPELNIKYLLSLLLLFGNSKKYFISTKVKLYDANEA